MKYLKNLRSLWEPWWTVRTSWFDFQYSADFIFSINSWAELLSMNVILIQLTDGRRQRFDIKICWNLFFPNSYIFKISKFIFYNVITSDSIFFGDELPWFISICATGP